MNLKPDHTKLDLLTKYCPRCDRAFKSKTAALAWAKVREHLKLAHPDYYVEMVKEP